MLHNISNNPTKIENVSAERQRNLIFSCFSSVFVLYFCSSCEVQWGEFRVRFLNRTPDRNPHTTHTTWHHDARMHHAPLQRMTTHREPTCVLDSTLFPRIRDTFFFFIVTFLLPCSSGDPLYSWERSIGVSCRSCYWNQSCIGLWHLHIYRKHWLMHLWSTSCYCSRGGLYRAYGQPWLEAEQWSRFTQ